MRCVRCIVNFTLMAQYESHIEDILGYLYGYLVAFHKHKDIFKEFCKDKATARRVREVKKGIMESHSKVHHHLRATGSSATQRQRIGDAQERELDEAIEAIYEKEVDFNFIKIHLLSHFRDHVRCFGNVTMYSTEWGETNHKQIIKEGYRRSNKNDATFQILNSYARLDSFRIHDMNQQHDLRKTLGDIPRRTEA